MSRTRLIFPALLLFVVAACSSPEPATDQIEETPAPEVPAPAPAPVVTDTMPPIDTGAAAPAAPATAPATPPTGG